MSIDRAAIIDVHTHPHMETADLSEDIALAGKLGIGAMVLLADVLGFGYDPTPEDIRAINDNNMGLARRYPEFCRGFCFLNPLNAERFTLEELDRCVALGAIGVKLEVSVFASDRRVDPIMRRLQELGLPLLQHCWYTLAMGKESSPGCMQTDAEDIAILAARFPKVTIIAAHMRPNGYRGILEVKDHGNVHWDTSGGQPISGVVEYAVRMLGAERVLYGSDAYFPAGRDFSCQLGSIYGSKIRSREKDLILGGNARRLLRLGGNGT